MKKVFVITLLILILFPVNSFSAHNKETWLELYCKSFDYLFNCEFDKAIAALNKAKDLDPYNPAIYWRLTFSLWFKAAYGKNSKKEINEMKKMFAEAFSKGVAICYSGSADSEILLYLGGLYGNKVFFEQAIGGSNKSLLENAQKSREYLRKIKKTDKYYDEACGYLGIFNYVPILMSGFQRLKARLAGYKWDESKGLQQIKEAIAHSTHSDDIKFLYIGILMELIKKKKDRNKIPEALYLVEGLIKKYPRNSFLKEDLKTLKDLKNKR